MADDSLLGSFPVGRLHFDNSAVSAFRDIFPVEGFVDLEGPISQCRGMGFK